MKPIYISFQAFGPYVEKQEIDFTALSKSGLFLICGETGAGKTTILDAMCYALYGQSSGGTRGDIATMRCQLADKDIDTEVVYIFSAGGKKYKFTRTLKYGRKNLNSFQNALVENEDGVYEPIFENPRINDVLSKAAELTGLSYNQFRQIIVLPQGQFEKLLISDSAEKEKILVTLFNADKWDKAASLVFDTAHETKKQLDLQKNLMESKLHENKCETVKELSELTETCSKAASENMVLLKEAQTKLAVRQKAQEQDMLLYQSFLQLEQEQKTVAALLSQKIQIETEKQRIALSETAAMLLPFCDRLNTANENRSRRSSALLLAQKESYNAEKQLKVAMEAFEKTAQEQEKVDRKKEICSQYSLSLPFYESAESIHKKLQTVETVLNKAQKEEKKSADILEETKQNLSLLETSRAELYRKCGEIFTLYASSISSLLAADLKEGEACPVCGSRSHPQPAQCSKSTVTELQKNEAQKKLQEADQLAETKRKDCYRLETQYTAHMEKTQEIKAEYEKLSAQYQAAASKMIANIDSISALKEKISVLQQQIEAFEQKKELCIAQKTAAEVNCASHLAQTKLAAQECTKAEEVYKAIQSEFQEAIRETPFHTETEILAAALTKEEKAELIAKTQQYTLSLAESQKKAAELSEELSEKKQPNLEKMQQEILQLQVEADTQLQKYALAEQEAKRMNNLTVQLTEQSETYEKQRLANDEVLSFAQLLRGDTGISIQRYVLGVMLSAVTTQANKLLKEIHGGRYTLHRCMHQSQGRTRKYGLDLEVLDSLSGECRSVVSLSGGEKFLVALSLSIGLSAVVQSQSGATRLGAMFIDEGFGSLDSSSVNDALAVLSHVKNGNGMVGIISHVAALRENIPTRVEITKTNRGSSCKIIAQ